jgi:hypothetical protein
MCRVRYYFHPHAVERMQNRMAKVGIGVSDVLSVIGNPVKIVPAEFGRTHAWGWGANGIRIRVTYNTTTGEIRTVAIADGRIR